MDQHTLELRELIVRYGKATLKWSDSLCLSAETSADIVPMDVDCVLEKEKKGKKKGKGSTTWCATLQKFS